MPSCFRERLAPPYLGFRDGRLLHFLGRLGNPVRDDMPASYVWLLALAVLHASMSHTCK